jgi:hypothetical protein
MRGPAAAYRGKTARVNVRLTPVAYAMLESWRASKGLSQSDAVERSIRAMMGEPTNSAHRGRVSQHANQDRQPPP